MIEIIPNWHPFFVHFTVALVSISVAFHLLARLASTEPLREHWQIVANWTLWSGALITVITVIAGWYAYNTVAHDEPSHQAMTVHRNWALATAALVLLAAAWSWWIHRKKHSVSAILLAVLLTSGALVGITGWHGAEAVYRYGLGVMSLPEAEGEGHAHSHGDDGHGGSSHDTLMDSPHQNAVSPSSEEHHDDGHSH